MSIPIQTTTLKPRRWLVWLPVLMSILFIIGLKSGLDQQNQWVLIAPVLAMFVVFFAINKNRIIIDDQSVSHRNLLREKYISWHGVEQVYATYERRGKNKRLFFNFIKGDKKYRFPVAMYSRNSIQNLSEAISLKCSAAAIDPQIKEMASGRFPWYIF